MADSVNERMATEYKGDVPIRRTVPINGGSRIPKFCIAGIDAQGNARPGALIASGYVRTIGVAQATFDNTNGADGAITGDFRAGVWGPFVNNGNSITAAHLKAKAYVVDNQTVDASDDTGARAEAGTIEMVTAAGVYIFFS